MRRWLLLFLVCLGLGGPGWAQQIRSMEFRNQEIRDILLSLGELNGVSIVPDDTVDGKASYVFSNMAFEEALGTFLSSFNLSYYMSTTFLGSRSPLIAELFPPVGAV